LSAESELPLLALLARHYRLERATLTTRGESPAGAGIAGSSALAIAVCGALARRSNGSVAPDDLLQIAMNVECQTIRVPTGVQDYRPALFGGIAAIELRVDVIGRATFVGATAAKVCGAGGGGCLFCFGPPSKRAAISEALAAGGARILDYKVETQGLLVG